jgi:hypothetical protein
MAKPKEPAAPGPEEQGPSQADAQQKPRQQARQPRRPPGTDTAFDLWLHRNLHDLYDPITREPIPDSLLQLINKDREK